jgi:Glucuronyl esterase, fungi
MLAGAGLLLGVTVLAVKADPPKPGATGNPDNVPYIDKRDPNGNPVRLAKATGHVSNYSEDKLPKYTLPDPLVLASGKRVTDERVAAVFSVVPGEMGASLIRRDWGETLDDMAQNFPWQFAGNVQKWVGRWNDLPVDQHMLIALSAPRPVYVNGGLTDQWSDPKGEFLALVAAGPVYGLLGAKDLGVTEMPDLDKPVTTGSLAFHYHSGGHTAVPADWKAFLDFAERHSDAARK